MKKLCILFLVCLLAVLPAGCAKEEKRVDDGPKPWAAPTGATTAAETTEEWTKQQEMETLAALENDGASITLPDGVTAADIEQAEKAFWMAFFYTPLEPSPVATAQGVLPYLTNGAVPWGLLYLYDTFDPAHTHGAYEKLSVADEPDPQALFPDEYYKVDESVLFFLFSDVFGARPDWTVSTDGYYFDDGYGYFTSLPTGIEGFETHVRACQTISEGHYRLTLELLIADNEEQYAHSRSSFIDASIVDADGLRYWRIERVEPFE